LEAIFRKNKFNRKSNEESINMLFKKILFMIYFCFVSSIFSITPVIPPVGKAEVKNISSPEVSDLKAILQKDLHEFGFFVDVTIGEKEKNKVPIRKLSLHLFVCSPEWLVKHATQDQYVLFGIQHVIMSEYNYETLEKNIKSYVDALGTDWKQIIEKIGSLEKMDTI
jgi:hypothetical protein